SAAAMLTYSRRRRGPTTTPRRRWGSSSWEVNGRSRWAPSVRLGGLGRRAWRRPAHGGWESPAPGFRMMKEGSDAHIPEMGPGPRRPGLVGGGSSNTRAVCPRRDGCRITPPATKVCPAGTEADPRGYQEGYGVHEQGARCVFGSDKGGQGRAEG